jgi:hypothetical protein
MTPQAGGSALDARARTKSGGSFLWEWVAAGWFSWCIFIALLLPHCTTGGAIDARWKSETTCVLTWVLNESHANNHHYVLDSRRILGSSRDFLLASVMHLSISQLSELTGRERRTVSQKLADVPHIAGRPRCEAVRIRWNFAADLRRSTTWMAWQRFGAVIDCTAWSPDFFSVHSHLSICVVERNDALGNHITRRMAAPIYPQDDGKT